MIRRREPKQITAPAGSRPPYAFTALCAAGLEGLVAQELRDFGATITRTASTAILFQGTLATAYRACLWSRFANRILLPITTFQIQDTDDLHEGSRTVPWQEHCAVDSSFAVHCTTLDAVVEHSHFAALRVKDGIVDHFRERCGRRPSVSQTQPDLPVHVFINNTAATLSIDLSGESLHIRGYRVAGGEAPLKETLAAALVHLAGWSGDSTAGSVLLDPLCGSGTLLLEAALISGAIAPGLGRGYFGFLKWRGHDPALWEQLLKEAKDIRQQALHGTWPVIIGYDADGSAVQAAAMNIKKAGLQKIVHVEQRELAAFDNPATGRNKHAAERKLVIVNPPYGERLETPGSIKYLYRCLGRKLKQHCAGWQAGIFTSSVELADALGMQPLQKHRLFNGSIPCHLYLYDMPQIQPEHSHPALRPEAVSVTEAAAQGFANRFQKNMRRVLPRAQREGISCVRIYDADMPEYNLAVDLYEQWVHVQEYAPPKTVDPAKAQQRMLQSLRVIQQVLGIGRSQLFIKIRQRQKGKQQYQKRNTGGRLFEVREGPCRLLVNLTDYIDTGLFLDHRITRSMIGKAAAGKRFLNLFGYTGSATVHAALGGARSSITVDRSPVYCAWTHNNLMLNGFSREHHRVIRADCMQWLAQCHERFDLVFADPPTFSNRKSTDSVFDVQRDHVALIQLIMRHLAPDGLLIFSTNFRRFQLDGKGLAGLRITDISRATIPFDFQRNQRVHQCWEIRHS